MKIQIKLATVILAISTTVVSPVASARGNASDQDRKILSEACQILNSSVQRASCFEAITRLGRAKSSQSTSGKDSVTALELITLKGIPFDTPDATNAVISLCLTSTKYYTLEELKDSNSRWCHLLKDGRISIPNFSYGNLQNNTSDTTVASDGSLLTFNAPGSSSEMLELASLLSDKYGKPVVKETQISNNLGAKFDKKVFIWIDQRGTRITIYSIYDEINKGRIIIESASEVKAVEKGQNFQNKVFKSNL